MNSPLVVLIVMDGWGMAPSGPGNPILAANLPNIRKFWSAYPHTTLLASGEAVGLPRGEVGNTETGHLNLGAGRIVYQDLLRINMAIANGSFAKNEAFSQAIDFVKKNNSKLHLMGLIGGGGVHSSTEHLYALLNLCKTKGLSSNVVVHAFTDGRDSPPDAGITYVANIEQFMQKEQVGKFASVMGRYWAMDRDQRWERTKVAYDALTKGVAEHVVSIKQAIQKSYDAGVTDEFIHPSILLENGTTPYLIRENDAVIFFNFRIDRPRQLTSAFVFEDLARENEEARITFDPYAEKYFKKHNIKPSGTPVFDRGQKIKNLYFVTMTEYEKPAKKYTQAAFPPEVIRLPLGEVIASKNFRQLRLAESEKERFVTYYFNGQRDLPFPGETRIIAPSPNVATYDLAPQMSADETVKNFLNTATSENDFRFVLINFANPDMVGHTGNYEATKKAVETVDKCVAEIVGRVDSLGGTTLITADHGNAEELLKPDGTVDTEHSLNPVPLIIVGKNFVGNSQQLQRGILADVAPTVLKLLGIIKPQEMTGRSLI